jgi:DeoR family transcriptional regulator of aga operon/DeoR family fructose operon transcriptional repressor
MPAVTEKRRSDIIDFLSSNRAVRVADLSAHLGVSEVSIRRDLQRLEEQGLLKRVHGGAVSINPESLGSVIQARLLENRDKKARIGQAAASLISEGERIFMDSGSTTLQVAHCICGELLNSGNLTVITGSLPVVHEIGACPGVHLIVLGGIYLPEYEILVGPQTVDQLKGLHADKMFLGTDGITHSQGLTTANVLEAEVDRAMVKAASEVIVVSDSSKIGLIGLVTIMPLANIHKLITDTDAPPDFVASLRELGIEVILV